MKTASPLNCWNVHRCILECICSVFFTNFCSAHVPRVLSRPQENEANQSEKSHYFPAILKKKPWPTFWNQQPFQTKSWHGSFGCKQCIHSISNGHATKTSRYTPTTYSHSLIWFFHASREFLLKTKGCSTLGCTVVCATTTKRSKIGNALPSVHALLCQISIVGALIQTDSLRYFWVLFCKP